MLIRLFGHVSIDGRPVTAQKHACMLAVLAARLGEPVSPGDLIDRIWDSDPPTTAVSVLYSQVARMRAWLRDHSAEIRRSSGGYVLDVDPDEVDLHRARGLAALADHTIDAVPVWREATALVQGEALAGVKGRWAEDFREAMHRERTGWRAARFAAELAAGHHAAVIDELAAAAQAEPLAESIAAAYMLALHRCGRPADALVVFDDLRRRLRDELGADPARELRALHRRILDHDPDLATPAPATFPLPATINTFAGRDRELSIMDDLLRDKSGQGLVTLIGQPGVGKTTLAVRWAHRARDRFPDGQLFVNLQGFDPGGHALRPGDALRSLLELLRVAPQQIPSTLEAQAGLYRSRLAGARMLVVLDNARDADQVRPLLPGSPGSMVVVTSRDQLTGLVTANGAHPVRLEALDDEEARHLLTKRIGQRRVDAEPDAVRRILATCCGLPLALAIVAARAVTCPGLPLETFAAQLASDSRLDALADTDPVTDVRAVFSWSYRSLPPPAARLFRLLGLHPGPDVGADAAASLAGVTPAQVRRLLAELTGAHLLTEPTPGRYAFHDLVRAYAAELAEGTDEPAQRQSALARQYDYYAHTAHSANRLLFPSRSPMGLPLADAVAAVSLTPLADFEQAMDWFKTEHHVLLAMLRRATGSGHVIYAWQLAWALDTFLHRSGYWQQQADAWRCALESAGRLGNISAQITAHRALASTLADLGRYDDAFHHLGCGLDLAAETGSQVEQGNIHRIFGFVHWRQGNPRQALHHALEALARFRSAGERYRVAGMLNNVGACYAHLDDHARAIGFCEQALSLLQEMGDHEQEAHTWDSLGYSHHHVGHHAQAIECYERAIALFRRLDDGYNRARTLSHLGDTHEAAADLEAARACWQQAVDIFTELKHADGESARAKLARLGA